MGLTYLLDDFGSNTIANYTIEDAVHVTAAISGGRLNLTQLSGAVGPMLHLTASPAFFNGSLSAQFGNPTADDTRACAYLRWVDASNFVRVEIADGAKFGLTTGYPGLRITKRVAGVDTVLGTTQGNAVSYGWSFASYAGGFQVDIGIDENRCYASCRPVADTASGKFWLQLDVSLSTDLQTNGYAGLGTTGPGVSQVWFDALRVRWWPEENASGGTGITRNDFSSAVGGDNSVTSDLGGSPTLPFSLVSGQLRSPSNGSYSFNQQILRWSGPPSNFVNGWVKIRCATFPTTETVNLYLRAQGTHGAATLNFVKVSLGYYGIQAYERTSPSVQTTRYDSAGACRYPLAGSIVRLEAVGANCYVYISGALVANWTTTLLSPGCVAHGVSSSVANASYYDDLAVCPDLSLAISTVSPYNSLRIGGDQITIVGANFGGDSTVTVGGVAATNVVVVNSYTITCTAPAHADGVVDVAVTSGGNTATKTACYRYAAQIIDSYTQGVYGSVYRQVVATSAQTQLFSTRPSVRLFALAYVTDVNPNPASISLSGAGLTWTLLGTQDGGSTSQRLYLYTATTVNALSNVRVTATWTGSGATTWSCELVVGAVRGAGGVGTFRSHALAYMNSPNYGCNIDGTTTQADSISIGGFSTLRSFNAVAFAAPDNELMTEHLVGINEAAIFACGPYGVGSRTITKYVWDSTFNQYFSVGVECFYSPPAASINTVSPSAGSVVGGGTITLTGQNFASVTGVTFGGTAATNLVIVDAATITCTLPAHAAGAVDIVALSPQGNGTKTNGFTYYAVPTFASLSQVVGNVAGGQSVTLTGTGLIGTTCVTLGGSAATSLVVAGDGLSLTCVTPAHSAAAVDVVLVHPGGNQTQAAYYRYQGAATITTLTPGSTGPDGMEVVLGGSNFTGATGVTIGGTAATNVAIISDSAITCLTPAKSPGLYAVVVQSPSGNGTYNSLTVAPTVTAVSPSTAGTAGLVSRTIVGVGFTGATSVVFGGTAATAVVILDDRTLTCTVPAHAVGTVNVSVTTNSVTGTGTGVFRYRAPPTLDSVSPSFGTTRGGTLLTVSGTSFEDPAQIIFLIDGIPATDVVVHSTTQITCKTPPHAAATSDVELISGDLSAILDGAFTFVPVTQLYLKKGLDAGGTIVEFRDLDGLGIGATGITFDGVPASDHYFSADGNYAWCVAPPHAPGLVDIYLQRAANTLAWSFDLQQNFGCTTFYGGVLSSGPYAGRRAYARLTWGAVNALFGGDAEIGYQYTSNWLEDDAWPEIWRFAAWRPDGTWGSELYSYIDHPSEQVDERFGENVQYWNMDNHLGWWSECYTQYQGQGPMRMRKARYSQASAPPSGPPNPIWWDNITVYNDTVPPPPGFPGNVPGVFGPVGMPSGDKGGPNGFDVTSTWGWVRIGGGFGRADLHGSVSYLNIKTLTTRNVGLGQFRYYCDPRPKIVYRAFRSDDLSHPMFGPVELRVPSATFERAGVLFEARARELNSTGTGQLYDLDAFPMLRGFL